MEVSISQTTQKSIISYNKYSEFLEIKNKKRGPFPLGVGVGHVPRKYVFKKKRLNQAHQIGDMQSSSSVPGTPINGATNESVQNLNVLANFGDGSDNSGLVSRSKNTSPIPGNNKNDK
jgi:hypothetical protein